MRVLAKKQLIEQFKKLGIKQGDLIEVNSIVDPFGYVVGGSQTIIDALIETVGYNGTILMQLKIAENSEPSTWTKPKVHPLYVQDIRNKLPAFDCYASNGKSDSLVDNLRRRKNVVISKHPSFPYVALGKYSKMLCNYHSLNFANSMESPAARFYELKGKILLLGSDYSSSNVVHLAEYYGDYAPLQVNCAMVDDDGIDTYKKYLDICSDNTLQFKIGKILENKGYIKKHTIGNSECCLYDCQVAIDTTIKYIKENSIVGKYR